MNIVQYPNRIIEEIKLNAFQNERTIYINEEITEETELLINRMFEKILKNDKREGLDIKDRKPINLKISSPGGSVFATLSIISTIESLKNKGYKIHGYSYGICMSGAFKIFISCSKRFAQSNTRFMYHQVQSYLGYTSVEATKRKLDDLEDLWTRCKKVIKKYTKITDEELDRITKEDRDVYLWTEHAIELGIVDEIF